MIAPLRSRHRIMTTVLAVAAPALFVVALASRNPVPRMTGEAMKRLAVLPSASSGVQWNPLPDGVLRWAVREDRVLELDPLASLQAPDVLVYLARTEATEGLPHDATLVGPYPGDRPSRYELPESPSPANAWVILYSLGHQNVLYCWPLSGAPDLRKED